jgi:soluble lytic murein transglycosylase-like protein
MGQELYYTVFSTRAFQPIEGEDDGMKQLWLIALVATAGWAQTVSDPPKAPPANAAPAATPAPEAGAAAPSAPTSVAPAPEAKAAPQVAMAASQSAMAASLEKQRASVVKQVGAVTGKTPPSAAAFFTVPWIDAAPQFAVQMATPFNAPICDPLPNDQLDPLIEQSAQEESVRTDLIRAVIGEESGSRPCAVSPKGAQGLMQLMPSTSEEFGVRDPFDPKQNVEAGTKLLKQLLTKYGGDIKMALSAYNAGADRVDKDGGVPQIPETINYVNDILSKLASH